MHRFILIGLLFFLLPPLYAQERVFRFSGYVKDAETGENLQGVSVYIHETGKKSVSASDGFFLLDKLRPGTYHIHADLMGYAPFAQNFKVLHDTAVEIRLKPTFIELKNFVIENDRLKTEAVKSSLDVEMADREFFEKENGNTFAQSLEKIPGIASLNVGVGIAKPVIRGMTFNRVVVNDQGVKQEGQQWGADHGLELDAFNVDRVEIIKGPSSLLYGSDAIGGIINILPPIIAPEGSIRGEISGIGRTNNAYLGSTAMIEGNKKRNFFRVRATWAEYGDYKVPADSFTYNSYRLPIENERLKNTAGKELHFSAGGGMMRDWGMLRVTVSRFGQTAGLFPGAMGIPRAYQLTHDGNSRNVDLPRQQNSHLKALASLNVKTRHGWLENDFGYQFNHRQEQAVPHLHGYAPSPAGNTALELGLRTLSLNSRLHHSFTPRWKIITGMQAQHMDNSQDGFEFLIPAYTSYSAGAYGFTEFFVNEKTTVNGGLRFDYGHVNLAGYNAPVYDQNLEISGYRYLSPKMERDFYNVSGAAGLSFEPSQAFNIKVNVGRSFRMPTAPELGENGIHHGTFRHEMGDSSLKSETGYQFDLAFILHNKNFIAKLTPYFNYFDNYIFLRPAAEFSPLPDAGQIYRYTQARAVHGGFELYADYHFIESLHLEGSIAYIRNLNLDTYLPLPFTPPPSGMLSLEYTREEKGRVKKWFLSTDVRHFLAQNRVDRNERATPGYTLFSASAGIELKMAGTAIQIFLRGYNLLDTYYLNHISRYRLLNLPEQGRNFSVLLKIPFGKRE